MTYEGLAVTRSLLPLITSMVLRFIRRVKKAHLRAEENKNSEAEIAEILWFKQIQLDLPNHPSFETWKKQFGLFWG